MAGLQAPLSTLRLAPRDALRMTRGQRGLLFLYCEDFHLLLFAQSPGALAYVNFLFLRCPLDAPRESSWRPCAESLFPSRSFLAIGQTVGSLWFHLVLGQRIQEIFSPVPHRIDDRLQGLAALGNGIFHLRWNLSVDLALDYAVFLQLAQLRCEHALSGIWNELAKLAVSLGTVAEEDKEDFSLPLSSDDLGARLNRATQSIIASVSHSVF